MRVGRPLRSKGHLSKMLWKMFRRRHTGEEGGRRMAGLNSPISRAAPGPPSMAFCVQLGSRLTDGPRKLSCISVPPG